MRQFRFFVLICLLLSLLPIHAQEMSSPIIALKDDGIYAVSPVDGSAELLVPAPENYEEIYAYTYSQVLLTTAEWLSPDGQYLPYRVIAPMNPDVAIEENEGFKQELFILDLQSPEQPIAIDLAPAEPQRVESVAWSFDNTKLYVLGFDRLSIYERETWTFLASVEVDAPHSSQAPVATRRIFATEDGLVLVDTGANVIAVDFFVFDADGNHLRDFQVNWDFASDVNLYVNTPFTPLEMDGHVVYPFVDMYAVYLLYQADFATGEVSEGDYATPGMVSRTALDSSLHVFIYLPTDKFTSLLIFDNEDNYLDAVDGVPYYAFGILGDNIGSTFALSPDGQQVAYLENGNLMLWHDGERQSLDFEADVVVWSPSVYMPFKVDYFVG